jgi:hypothetical protein
MTPPYRGQRRGVHQSIPTISWAQKDLLSDQQLEEVKNEYPEDSLEVAIQKYARKHSVQGVFFLDDDGERCVYQDGRSMLTLMTEHANFMLTIHRGVLLSTS